MEEETVKCFGCCVSCFDKIAQKKPKAANLWLNICNVYTSVQGLFAVKNFDTKELRYLERNGFLVTSDDDEYIVIKLKGCLSDSKQNFVYCIEPKNHANGKAEVM